ncbi:prohead protease/major capsid protein fusion protein [Jhaorihella thermophila]|uniref:Prohead serine protease n=1 Tax=Jhaorihella thermophila TaxID=488547 RepID=A0A1H5Z5B0_9RHOB|nr:prohead protease/major capsid protein fusion protein [Jhaorihella thermophila]SEG31354.1 hypothetical protein SAMN05421751_1299 [Jhaorihella thermophila]
MPEDRVALPALTRAAEMVPASLNEAERTVDVIWTTGARVARPRLFGDPVEEELSLAPGAVRLERLNSGAPFLAGHGRGLGDVLGVVVEGSARIEDGRGIATIRISRREEVEPFWRDVRDGVIRNVSVGYRVHRFEVTARRDGPDLYRAVDWEPLEISAVAIGADPGARTRASDDAALCHIIRPTSTRTEDDDMPEATPTTPAEDEDRTRAAATEAGAEAAQVSAPPPADEDRIRAEERARAREILALCRRHGIEEDVAERLIAEGATLDAARAAILEALASSDPLGERVVEPAPARARDDRADRAQAEAIASALMHRFDPGRELAPGARDFRGLSLMEIARHVLERGGVSTAGLTRMELAGAALMSRAGMHSTSDFPAILANVAGKTLRTAYERTPRTFTAWARRTAITDFKPVSRVQLSGAPDLQKVLEGGEFQYGTIGEGKEVYALASYGRILAITRQALINDDLDAFTRIPAAFGAAAADLESDIVYAILNQNPAMADGKALFHASHGNLASGSAITETALAEAWRAFGKQTGLEGRLISVLPRWILVPPGTRALEARKHMTATTPASAADVNPYAGRLEIVEEPRLIPASGNDPWFLAADPARVDTVEYAHLEGHEGVFIETRSGFEVDGIEIKARHDFAAKAIDWRGLYKNPGA